ncbi:30S ribosomal protein S6 [Sandaracinus amylolyticus]|uniref:Small ribosomal subunit protein bS6 n=1 Tax=Sandaracinus amylolyticus TaxID=927083 RepID=A0A0F6W5N7_9BACT|nr:30S ribosomal protein S6 [Sandaracinus amylolyticus]AKF08137.1 SSU ribosomal protein S6p [Sandaracinus amylolyticus]
MQQSAAATSKRLAREYELVYILTPNVDPDDADKVATRIQEVVARLGGKITKVDSWGRRRLAYPIKKSSRGVFVYVRYIGFNDLVAELERNLRNADAVIRFQTVRREGVFDLAEVTVDPEEAKFSRIEAAPLEEEPEPSFEERLGLTQKPREREEEDFLDMGDEDDVVPGAEKPEDETTEK